MVLCDWNHLNQFETGYTLLLYSYSASFHEVIYKIMQQTISEKHKESSISIFKASDAKKRAAFGRSWS